MNPYLILFVIFMGLNNNKPSNVWRSTKFTNIFQFRKFYFAKNLLPFDIWIKFSRNPSLRIIFKLSFSLKLSSLHTLQFRTLHRKFPYLELFWFAVSCIRTEYGEILRISPYSVQMRENMDQNNSEYGHFSRNGKDFDLTQPIRCQYSY